MTQFDPYYIWLGIPPHQQPPNHYRLLGLAPFESDVKAIAEAAEQQARHIRMIATESQAEELARMLKQLAQVKACLCNDDARAKYDQALRERAAAARKERARMEEQQRKAAAEQANQAEQELAKASRKAANETLSNETAPNRTGPDNTVPSNMASGDSSDSGQPIQSPAHDRQAAVMPTWKKSLAVAKESLRWAANLERFAALKQSKWSRPPVLFGLVASLLAGLIVGSLLLPVADSSIAELGGLSGEAEESGPASSSSPSGEEESNRVQDAENEPDDPRLAAGDQPHLKEENDQRGQKPRKKTKPPKPLSKKERLLRTTEAAIRLDRRIWKSKSISPGLNQIESLVAEIDGAAKVLFEDEFSDEGLDRDKWRKRDIALVADDFLHLQKPGVVDTKREFRPGEDGAGVLRVSGTFKSHHPSFFLGIYGEGRYIDDVRVGFGIEVDEQGEAMVRGICGKASIPLRFPTEWNSFLKVNQPVKFVILDTGRDKFLSLRDTPAEQEQPNQWIRIPSSSTDKRWSKHRGRAADVPQGRQYHPIGLACSSSRVLIDRLRVERLPWPVLIQKSAEEAAEKAKDGVEEPATEVEQDQPPGEQVPKEVAPPAAGAEVENDSLRAALMELKELDHLSEAKEYVPRLNAVERRLRSKADDLPTATFEDSFESKELDREAWVVESVRDKEHGHNAEYELERESLWLGGDALLRLKLPLPVGHRHAATLRVSGFVTLENRDSYLCVRSRARASDAFSGIGMGMSWSSITAVRDHRFINLPRGDMAVGISAQKLRFIYYDTGWAQFLSVHDPDETSGHEWVIWPAEDLRGWGDAKDPSQYVSFRVANSGLRLDEIRVDRFVLPEEDLTGVVRALGAQEAAAPLAREQEPAGEVTLEDYHAALAKVQELDEKPQPIAVSSPLLSQLDDIVTRSRGKFTQVVFHDDFEGKQLDMNRWQPPSHSQGYIGVVDGKLLIRDFFLNAGKERKAGIRLITRREFRAGKDALGVMRISGVLEYDDEEHLGIGLWRGDLLGISSFRAGVEIDTQRISATNSGGFSSRRMPNPAAMGSAKRRRFVLIDTGAAQYLTLHDSDSKKGKLWFSTSTNRATHLQMNKDGKSPEVLSMLEAARPHFVGLGGNGGKVRIDDFRIESLPLPGMKKPLGPHDGAPVRFGLPRPLVENPELAEAVSDTLKLERQTRSNSYRNDVLVELDRAFLKTLSRPLVNEEFENQAIDGAIWSVNPHKAQADPDERVAPPAIQDGRMRVGQGSVELRLKQPLRPGQNGIGIIRVVGLLKFSGAEGRFQVKTRITEDTDEKAVGFQTTPDDLTGVNAGLFPGINQKPIDVNLGNRDWQFTYYDTGPAQYVLLHPPGEARQAKWYSLPVGPFREDTQNAGWSRQFLSLVMDHVEVDRLRVDVMPRTPEERRPVRRKGKEPGDTITNSIGMKLKVLPTAAFLMGSDPDAQQETEPDSERQANETPRHRVQIGKRLAFGVHEVTQAQFRRVTKRNPSFYSPSGKGKDEIRSSSTTKWPVDSVTWSEARMFCSKLSALKAEKKAGRKYRLPTEAEWEFACRAGTATNYSTGDLFESLRWYANLGDNVRKPDGDNPGPSIWFDDYRYASPVGQFRPNRFGLYDMHGNVAEWCHDRYDSEYYQNSPDLDPTGAREGERRVVRGGSHRSHPDMCRSAYRRNHSPNTRLKDVGFRVVLELE